MIGQPIPKTSRDYPPRRARASHFANRPALSQLRPERQAFELFLHRGIFGFIDEHYIQVFRISLAVACHLLVFLLAQI